MGLLGRLRGGKEVPIPEKWNSTNMQLLGHKRVELSANQVILCGLISLTK